MASEALGPSQLFVLETHRIDTDDCYVPFTCKAFIQSALKWAGGPLCVGTDATLSVLSTGWSVATMVFWRRMVSEQLR